MQVAPLIVQLHRRLRVGRASSRAGISPPSPAGWALRHCAAWQSEGWVSRGSSGAVYAPDPGRRLCFIYSIQAMWARVGTRGTALRPRSAMLGSASKDSGGHGFSHRLVPILLTTLRTAPCGLFCQTETVTLASIPHISAGSCTWRTRRPQGSSGGSGRLEADAFTSGSLKEHQASPPQSPALASLPSRPLLPQRRPDSTALTSPPHSLINNSSMVPVALKIYLLLLHSPHSRCGELWKSQSDHVIYPLNSPALTSNSAPEHLDRT